MSVENTSDDTRNPSQIENDECESDKIQKGYDENNIQCFDDRNSW